MSVGVGGLRKDELTTLKASKALCHKNYDSPGRLNNDIALLRLDTPLDLSLDNIGAAVLPDPGVDILTAQSGTVIVKPIGWGTMETGSLSETLLEVDLSVDPAKTDQYGFETYPSTGIAVGSCQGDSGGPVNVGTTRDEASGMVLGVVSYTTAHCNSTQNTSGFARVSTYRNEIESALAFCDQEGCFE